MNNEANIPYLRNLSNRLIELENEEANLMYKL